MRTAHEGASRSGPPAELLSGGQSSAKLLKSIVDWLDDAKAEKIVSIDLHGKSSIGDFMVIASGRSDRHVGAVAEQIQKNLKAAGVTGIRMEGQETCDWVLIDAGDIIIHVFQPEVRDFYNLERMWLADRPADKTAH